jgi:ketosteroid isomerase-like protein
MTRFSVRRLLVPALAIIALALTGALTPPPLSGRAALAAAHPGRITANDSSDVVAVILRFDSLMAAGDSTGLLALLADDAVILESGGMETRAEFRSHHLPADIRFARAVKARQGPITVQVQGDAAWASSTSTVEGEVGGRAINSVSAELMVLSREAGGWKIRAIHWSSRTRRPPPG